MIEHVRACNEHGNQVRGDEPSKLPPRIPGSQIGHCLRQAIFDAARWHPDHALHVAPTHPFDDCVLEITEAGSVWEYQQGQETSDRRRKEARVSHLTRQLEKLAGGTVRVELQTAAG